MYICLTYIQATLLPCAVLAVLGHDGQTGKSDPVSLPASVGHPNVITTTQPSNQRIKAAPLSNSSPTKDVCDAQCLIVVCVFVPLLLAIFVALLIVIKLHLKYVSSTRDDRAPSLPPPHGRTKVSAEDGYGDAISNPAQSQEPSRSPRNYTFDDVDDDGYVTPIPAVIGGPWAVINGRIVPRPPMPIPGSSSNQEPRSPTNQRRQSSLYAMVEEHLYSDPKELLVRFMKKDRETI